ncbi:hypothetical protein EYS09_14350 [Streptomyces kasugaensis]|uniref:Uncharacterized protein n=1 Tax=Streptomyces kasugaensis TaxID=1946 RepID=A0A4Q9HXJ2_STRKA|nr:hypothetical protein [Streptomyces kasugaensis]TBO59020.1 hypothetical protein EYS09_14350 [Streptomyces kasugaensis]
MEQKTLAERADITTIRVGRGTRVHYTADNIRTLCGRTAGATISYSDTVGVDHCIRCTTAAEQRVEAARLAAEPPLAAAAVALADTIEATDAKQAAAEVAQFGADVDAVTAPAIEEQQPAKPDEPSDTWTIMTRSGEEIARVEGATVEDMTRAAEALPAVRASIKHEGGFARRRLYTSELAPAKAVAEDPVEIELHDVVEAVVQAEAAAGTWRGGWIVGTSMPADEALFDLGPADAEQGALFA